MHGLKCLQDEGITGGGGCNTLRKGSVNEVDEEGRGKECDIVMIVVSGGKEVRSAREGIGAG